MDERSEVTVTEMKVFQQFTITEAELREITAMRQDDLFILAAVAHKLGYRIPKERD